MLVCRAGFLRGVPCCACSMCYVVISCFDVLSHRLSVLFSVFVFGVCVMCVLSMLVVFVGYMCLFTRACSELLSVSLLCVGCLCERSVMG